MSVITQGRTKGYFTVENYIQDGLLEVGGIDLAGFYTALKRFIDRREGASPGDIMNWSIDTFCRRFKMGKNRFYRLAEMLWQLGLLDVDKVMSISGWQNSYVIHDCPPYEGKLRIYREGSFKYKKPSEDMTNVSVEQILTGENSVEGGNSDMGTPSKEEIPKSGIPAIGISESGIPPEGSFNTGIPGVELINIQALENTSNQEIYPSIHHCELTMEEGYSVQKEIDGGIEDKGKPLLTNLRYKGRTPTEIISDIQKRTGVTPEQLQRAVKRANEMDLQGKVKKNYFGLLETICQTILVEDQAKNLTLEGSLAENRNERRKKALMRSMYL
ncbi:hypothetical protein [Desulforamulus aquiferis]|uniref:Bacteriophage lambda Replication protein O N-terminal domain-containing protein n=1 Tax=Desulforamulus aquiferis TaxID=1397668 RepID=A0AAW7Z8M2_9FIRM|nr:hypothetical protein [Desulforamulus aquiferis]MDO7785821.1 hypothetical protein [Desulforamulus aquiferis]